MRVVRVLLVVLVFSCVVIFGALVRSRMWGKRFQRVHAGADLASVLQGTGPPTRTMACSALPEPPAGCARVLVFAGPLSGVVPEFWLISFDSSERVLRVFHATRAD